MENRGVRVSCKLEGKIESGSRFQVSDESISGDIR